MQRKRLIQLLILLLLVLALAAIGFAWHQKNSSAHLVPVPNASGECPAGYVNYGVPLGCVTQQKYDDCKTHACPICLSNLTQIETQNGNRVVTSLRQGDLVWSIDGRGQKMLVPITAITKRAVPATTKLLQIALGDHRSIYVSPSHPTADGRLFSQLRVGDRLDGAPVTAISPTIYTAGYTYDILPGSVTGEYWANGILVGSTLKQ